MKCMQCGREFPVVASRAHRTKYCSRPCKSAAQACQVEHVCVTCGTTFTTKASHLGKYCSPACVYEDRTARVRILDSAEVEGLVQEHDGLVRAIAWRMLHELVPRMMDIDDFVQEGMIGLLTAYRTNTDTSQSFAPFAAVHIRYAILFAYRTQEHLIRLPGSLFRRDASVSEEEMQQFRKVAVHTSLDALPHDGDLAPRYVHVEETVLQEEQVQRLYRELLTLPEQQRTLLVLHYGLAGAEVAMRQLAYQFGLATVTTFREVHRGLDHLRRHYGA